MRRTESIGGATAGAMEESSNRGRRGLVPYVDRRVLHEVRPSRDPACRHIPLAGKLVFTFGLCWVTLALLISSIIIGAGFAPFSENPMLGPSVTALVQSGALTTVHVQNLQLWRLVWAPFLHAGLFHYAMNVLLWVQLGVMMEPDWGFWRVLFVFFAAALSGNLLSSALDPYSVSVGASGGIFGLMAGCICYVLEFWHSIPSHKMILAVVTGSVLAGLACGFMPYVDNYAHIGGTMGGLLAALATVTKVEAGAPPPRPMPKRRRYFVQTGGPAGTADFSAFRRMHVAAAATSGSVGVAGAAGGAAGAGGLGGVEGASADGVGGVGSASGADGASGVKGVSGAFGAGEAARASDAAQIFEDVLGAGIARGRGFAATGFPVRPFPAAARDPSPDAATAADSAAREKDVLELPTQKPAEPAGKPAADPAAKPAAIAAATVEPALGAAVLGSQFPATPAAPPTASASPPASAPPLATASTPFGSADFSGVPGLATLPTAAVAAGAATGTAPPAAAEPAPTLERRPSAVKRRPSRNLSVSFQDLRDAMGPPAATEEAAAERAVAETAVADTATVDPTDLPTVAAAAAPLPAPLPAPPGPAAARLPFFAELRAATAAAAAARATVAAARAAAEPSTPTAAAASDTAEAAPAAAAQLRAAGEHAAELPGGAFSGGPAAVAAAGKPAVAAAGPPAGWAVAASRPGSPVARWKAARQQRAARQLAAFGTDSALPPTQPARKLSLRSTALENVHDGFRWSGRRLWAVRAGAAALLLGGWAALATLLFAPPAGFTPPGQLFGLSRRQNARRRMLMAAVAAGEAQGGDGRRWGEALLRPSPGKASGPRAEDTLGGQGAASTFGGLGVGDVGETAASGPGSAAAGAASSSPLLPYALPPRAPLTLRGADFGVGDFRQSGTARGTAGVAGWAGSEDAERAGGGGAGTSGAATLPPPMEYAAKAQLRLEDIDFSKLPLKI